MRIAAIQMNSTQERSENLAQAHDLLLQALERKVDWVAFPENFSAFTEYNAETLNQAEGLNGVTAETLSEWAAEYGVWITGGTVSLTAKKGSNKVTNSCLVFNPDGERVARYDKIHLFDVDVAGDRSYRESSIVQPGKKATVFESPWCKVGLSVCYDLRFPELYRQQVSQGAEVLIVPSAFTAVTGKAHWDVLTRARAIENQCYLVAPAQVGSPYAGRETWGHTRIVDPWGRILAERPKGPGVVWADLNFEKLDQIRKDLPALQHRKL